ncbi:30358_t:CDS:2, partial [Racocetra persica]
MCKEAEEVNDIESESEDENKIYNPLKLFLDGMDQFHTGSINYTAIYAKYVYGGRKAFDSIFRNVVWDVW